MNRRLEIVLHRIEERRASLALGRATAVVWLVHATVALLLFAGRAWIGSALPILAALVGVSAVVSFLLTRWLLGRRARSALRAGPTDSWVSSCW